MPKTDRQFLQNVRLTAAAAIVAALIWFGLLLAYVVA